MGKSHIEGGLLQVKSWSKGLYRIIAVDVEKIKGPVKDSRNTTFL